MSAQFIKLNMLSGNNSTAFAQRNTTNKSDHMFSKVFEQITTTLKEGIVPRASRLETTPYNGSYDYEDIDHFRDLLMKTRVPLEKMYVSNKGIPFLKNFLNCCGFSKSDVQRLTNELLDANHASEEKINILDLFSKLSDLRTTVQKKKKDPVLEVAAIPHLEVALHRLGINARHIKEVLSEGRSMDGNLNLESFLHSLRRILDNTDQEYRGKSSDELADTIKQIFTTLGMNGEIEKVRGAISLDGFVQLLEAAVLKARHANKPTQNVEKTMTHLIGEMVVDSEESDSKLRLQSLATQQLIDDLLASKDKKKGSNDKQIPAFSHKGGARHITHEPNFDAMAIDTERFSRMLEHGFDDETYKAIWRDTQKINISETVAENHPFTRSIPAAQPSTIRSPHSLPLYVVDQVRHQIFRSIIQGKNNIRLRLKPPHLGTVKLGIEMKGNILKLDVTTENQVTKELLLSYSQELKQALLEQGIRLERIDIHANYQFGESMKNTQEEHNGEGDWARGRSSTSSTVVRIGERNKEEDIKILRTPMDGLLHLIA